jgi:broad specificity phosphatase PhoE
MKTKHENMIVGRTHQRTSRGRRLTNGVAELELLGDNTSVIVGVAHDGPASLVTHLATPVHITNITATATTNARLATMPQTQ